MNAEDPDGLNERIDDYLGWGEEDDEDGGDALDPETSEMIDRAVRNHAERILADGLKDATEEELVGRAIFLLRTIAEALGETSPERGFRLVAELATLAADFAARRPKSATAVPEDLVARARAVGVEVPEVVAGLSLRNWPS